MSKELKPKNVKNRVVLLRAMRYKDHPVYIRMIGTDLFMYDLIHNNEIYSSNLILSPKKGQTKLTKFEIQEAQALIWAGAVATIENLLGNTLDKQKAQLADQMIKLAKRNMIKN